MAVVMRVLTSDGVIAVEINRADDRSALATYWNGVRLFLESGDQSALKPFEGFSIAGHRLLTDPDGIEAWAVRGELEFENIYDATGR